MYQPLFILLGPARVDLLEHDRGPRQRHADAASRQPMTVSISRISSSTLYRAIVISIALVLGMAVSGCSRRTAAADDPTRLVMAMSTFSEATFLPWNGSTGRKFYLDTIYEYLAYMDPQTLLPQPGLAERWEMSPDGTTWAHDFDLTYTRVS